MADFSEIIPLGEWLPDKAAQASSGATVALNVISDQEDYRPFNRFNAVSVALNDKVLGGYYHLASNGTITAFVGTRTKLWRMVAGGTWQDITRTTGGNYITPVDGAWHFWQYGDQVIATNYVDDVQGFLVNTDTKFSKLITTGPTIKARVGGIINNFNVFGDMFDDIGQSPNRVRWSPINNPKGDYTPSQATQSDYQFCVDGTPGACMAIIGGQNYGIIVFKNAIYRMEYVGPPSIFKFTLMQEGVGAINDQCVASNGSFAFIRHESGFYLFDGSNLTAIGQGKVDEFFKAALAPNYLYNIRATTDPTNKVFLMAYTSNQSTDGTNDFTIVYNYVDGRWTLKEEVADVLMRGFTTGYTLEQIGALFPNIETVPYSFDSRYWQGGQTVLAGVDSTGVLGYYTGTPMDGYVESQEVRLNSNGTAYVDAVVPVFESGACQVRLGSRLNQNGIINYTPYITPNANTEEVNFTVDSRYHRVGLKISGSWKHAQGVRIKVLPSGYM